MAIKKFRPLTPTLRYRTVSDFSSLTKKAPEKSLLEPLKKSGGPQQHRPGDNASPRRRSQAHVPED